MTSRIAVSTSFLARRSAGLGPALEGLAAAGVEKIAVEWPRPAGGAEDLRAMLARLGLEVVAAFHPLGASARGDEPGDPPRPLREEIASVLASLKYAGRLPSPGLVLPPCFVSSSHGADGDGSAANGGSGTGGVRRGTDRSREAALDRLCRILHAACRAEPGARVAFRIAPGAGAVPDLAEAGRVFDEVRAGNAALWYDAASAVRREREAGEGALGWFDRYGDRVAGATLSDVDSGGAEVLPGLGTVDFRALLAACPRRAALVLRLPDGAAAAVLAESRRFLESVSPPRGI